LKKDKKKLLKLLIGGTINQATYTQTEAEDRAGIAAVERDLLNLQTQDETKDQFLTFAKEFRSIDMAVAWKLADPEQKRRVQTFLFADGISYSGQSKSFNSTNYFIFIYLEMSFKFKVKFGVPDGI
jgi:hypothetical protein